MAAEPRKALIIGITGQDGSYLAELLLERATRFTESSVALRASTPGASIIFIETHEHGVRLFTHYVEGDAGVALSPNVVDLVGAQLV